MIPRVVVVGAGISGLAAAFTLQQRARQEGVPLQLTAVDAAPRPGGHAQTRREDGFLLEAGPNGFLDRSPEARALAGALGLGPRLVTARPEAARRFILRGGRLCPVPASPVSLLTSPVLSWRGRLRVFGEPFARRPDADADETVYDFARRRIGAEAADVLVDTAVAGISAGDSRRLSLAAQFPMMAAMEREHGSLVRAMIARRRQGIGPPRMTAFDDGMGVFVGALAGALGPALRLSTPVQGLVRAGGGWRVQFAAAPPLDADRVLLAAPARAAAPMLQAADPQLAGWLQAVPYAGVAVVSLGYRAADLRRPLDGYGYLVARSEGLGTLGVVWESSLFPGRAPDGRVLLRVMLGGSRRPEIAGWTDDAKAALARDELAGVLGVTAAPVLQSVVTWPQAIAQYTVGHRLRRASIAESLDRLPGLSVCGSSYDGVSFTDAIASGVRAGESIFAKLWRGPAAAVEP